MRLVGDVYQVYRIVCIYVYKRINITRHESNIKFAFANQIISLNQNRKKMNERKKEIKYSTSYVCVRFAFIIRKSVRGIDR